MDAILNSQFVAGLQCLQELSDPYKCFLKVDQQTVRKKGKNVFCTSHTGGEINGYLSDLSSFSALPLSVVSRMSLLPLPQAPPCYNSMQYCFA